MALCSPFVVNRLLGKYVVRNGDVWQPIKRIAVGPARGLGAVLHSSQFYPPRPIVLRWGWASGCQAWQQQ